MYIHNELQFKIKCQGCKRKRFSPGIMNVYTRGILNLTGRIKEIHEENGMCLGFLQEETGIFRSRRNSKSIKIVQSFCIKF